MGRRAPTLIAMFCLSCAVGGYAFADQASPPQTREVRMAGQTPMRAIVPNANDCAPGRPEAVWGAGANPSGYVCSYSAN